MRFNFFFQWFKQYVSKKTSIFRKWLSNYSLCSSSHSYLWLSFHIKTLSSGWLYLLALSISTRATIFPLPVYNLAWGLKPLFIMLVLYTSIHDHRENHSKSIKYNFPPVIRQWNTLEQRMHIPNRYMIKQILYTRVQFCQQHLPLVHTNFIMQHIFPIFPTFFINL